MNSRTFIFLGLLFAVIVAVSSELVAPETSKDDIKKDEAEPQMVDEVNGRGGGGYGGGGRGRGGGGRGGGRGGGGRGGGGRGGGGRGGGGGSRGGGGGGRGGGGGGLEGEQGEVTIDVMEDAGINGGGGGYGGCSYRRCCNYGRCYCCAPNAAGDMVEDTTQN